jgi:hypothetical protein
VKSVKIQIVEASLYGPEWCTMKYTNQLLWLLLRSGMHIQMLPIRRAVRLAIDEREGLIGDG